MKNKTDYFFKYIFLPFFIGWCLPVFTSFTEDYEFVGIKYINYVIGDVSKNTKYGMSLTMILLIFLIGFVVYIFERVKWKNKKSIEDKYKRFFQFYLIFASFYIGMNLDSIKNKYENFKGDLKNIVPSNENRVLFYVVLLFVVYLLYDKEFMEFFKVIFRKKVDSENDGKGKENLDDSENRDKLIQSRENQKNLLIQALKNKAIKRILIDGEWGIGKTTFLKMTFNSDELKEKIYVIEIDVMIFNTRERIKEEFFAQLKPILKKEKIYFENGKEYIEFIDNVGGFFGNVFKYIFYKSNSFHEAKENFKDDLSYMKKEDKDRSKEIIVVFDNLERIVNSSILEDNTFKEVIGFIHEISEDNKNIKSIMVSNYEKIKNNDKDKEYHEEYLEKFYDFKIFLGKCKVSDILQAKYLENNDNKEIYSMFQDVFDALNESIDLKYEKTKEKESFGEKRKLFQSEIQNPRVIDKILTNYQIIDKFHKSSLYESLDEDFKMLISIYSEIHYEDLKNSEELEIFKLLSNDYIDAFFRIKKTKGRKIYDTLDKLNDDLKKKIKMLLFNNKSEENEAITIVRNLSEGRYNVSKLFIKNNLYSLQLYVEMFEITEQAIIAYNEIIRNLKIHFGNDHSGFLDTINCSIVWKMEEYLYKGDEGELCKYIKEKGINNTYAIKGIDFYILLSFKDILIPIIEFISYDKETERGTFEYKYYFDSPVQNGDKVFQNYSLLARQIYKILDKEEANGFPEKSEILGFMNDKIDGNTNLFNNKSDKESLKNHLKRFFDRMYIFIDIWRSQFDELLKPEGERNKSKDINEKSEIDRLRELSKEDLIDEINDKSYSSYSLDNLKQIIEVCQGKLNENETNLKFITILTRLKKEEYKKERWEEIKKLVIELKFDKLEEYLENGIYKAGNNDFINNPYFLGELFNSLPNSENKKELGFTLKKLGIVMPRINDEY